MGKNVYKHPGTLIEVKHIQQLKHIIINDNGVKKAYDNLLQFVSDDILKPHNAKKEVRVSYNPAPHDLAKLEPIKREQAIKEKAEEEKLIKEGKIAGHEQFTVDCVRTYKHTLAFLFTGQQKYAKKAVEILNAWVSICKMFGKINQNGPLEAGWGLASIARSAEILKYTFPFWEIEFEKRLILFIDSILMPQLKYYDKNGVITDFPAYGNWGATIVEARLQYAIFRENDDEYNFCLKNFELIQNNLIEDSGKEIETLRDIVHAQFGLGGLAGISELFYNQGKNVYKNMLSKSFEYHAQILLGIIPQDIKGQKLNWVDWIPTNWEIVYHHFVNRDNTLMPFTKKLLEKERPEDYIFHWGLGTLTHYGFVAG